MKRKISKVTTVRFDAATLEIVTRFADDLDCTVSDVIALALHNMDHTGVRVRKVTKYQALHDTDDFLAQIAEDHLAYLRMMEEAQPCLDARQDS